MRKAMIGKGQGLGGGDELAIVYTGHGVGRGLNGVESVRDSKTYQLTDILPHADLAAEANRAVSGGYHLEMIVDACQSDGLATAMRKSLENEGSMTQKHDIKDNAYDRLPTGERQKALQQALDDKKAGYAPVDYLAKLLENNTEMANRK